MAASGATTFGSPWARLVIAVESRGVSLKDSQGDVIAEKLMLAGYPRTLRRPRLRADQERAGLVLPCWSSCCCTSTGLPSAVRLYLIIAAAATVGMYPPNFIVSSGRPRARRSPRRFPDRST